MKKNLTSPIHVAVALTLAVGGLACAQAQSLTTELVADTDWIVRWQGQTVCVYHFGPDLKKPYVRELRTLKGHNILRDAPADHLHHHALMYGIRVNDLNFWEEAGDYGIQKPLELLSEGSGENRRGQPRAWFRQRLAWVSQAPDAAPLLHEQRTLSLTVNPDTEELALVWRSRFEVPEASKAVVLSGANYHGLGLRFLPELDPLAVHWVGGEKPDLGNNRQDVRSAPWAAVTFDHATRPATLVLAGSPRNQGAPSHFFSMLTPFAYLSATQNLDQKTLEYSPEDQWTVTHLVLLYPGVKPAETISQRVTEWTAAQERRRANPPRSGTPRAE